MHRIVYLTNPPQSEGHGNILLAQLKPAVLILLSPYLIDVHLID